MSVFLLSMILLMLLLLMISLNSAVPVLLERLLTIRLENKPSKTKKVRILPSRPMEIFSKGLTHDIWSKIGIFVFACF